MIYELVRSNSHISVANNLPRYLSISKSCHLRTRKAQVWTRSAPVPVPLRHHSITSGAMLILTLVELAMFFVNMSKNKSKLTIFSFDIDGWCYMLKCFYIELLLYAQGLRFLLTSASATSTLVSYQSDPPPLPRYKKIVGGKLYLLSD